MSCYPCARRRCCPIAAGASSGVSQHPATLASLHASPILLLSYHYHRMYALFELQLVVLPLFSMKVYKIAISVQVSKKNFSREEAGANKLFPACRRPIFLARPWLPKLAYSPIGRHLWPEGGRGALKVVRGAVDSPLPIHSDAIVV